MQTLGVVESISNDITFRNVDPVPARPTARNAFDNSVTHASRKGTDEAEMNAAVAATLQQALDRARLALKNSRTTTTLALLAQALESCSLQDKAVEVANEVLSEASFTSRGKLLDPIAVRVAIEILLRAQDLDKAVEIATSLPVDAQTKLLVAAALSDAGDFEKARELIDEVDSEDKEPLLAFVLLSENKNKEAIPILRSALRRHPADADSAHNLSVAFLRMGSERKALASALRATRSAPGRQDISLRYLEMLLTSGRPAAVLAEIERLIGEGVKPVAQIAVLQARASLIESKFSKAEQYLQTASDLARKAGDDSIFIEVVSNLVRLRAANGRIKHASAMKQLIKLNEEHPTNCSIVANIAQLSTRRADVPALKRSFVASKDYLDPERTAYIQYKIASLEGDNVRSAVQAEKWLSLEPRNAYAASAAMVALGIGVEDWDAAAAVAQRTFVEERLDPTLLNNAAYVIAMSGRPLLAISLLEPYASSDPVLKATLGLAYLAAGDVHQGMRLYREADHCASTQGSDFRSLMTMHQALVVRQLGLDKSTDPLMLTALSLVPVNLPDDWAQRPEFLRLHALAEKHGYPWPLSL
ncbi:tetratricopeptide repeat protein [Arthrobacter sp. HLT1-20]